MTPDPSRILNALTAYWRTNAVTAAIAIDLFTALGRERLTAGQLARRCGAAQDRLERLCDYLVSTGLLAKSRGRYRAARDAACFLDDRSADALTGVAGFFNAPALTAAFSRLADTLRQGPASASRAASSDALWRTFARQTLPLRRLYARVLADDIERRRLNGGRILDIGAGASPLGVELLTRNPTAMLTVQDRAGVVAVAREHARQAGVDRRVTVVRGDALTAALGGPFDLVLMINVLDYFEGPARDRLLRRAHRALAPGGVLVVGAPLAHARRTSPPEAVAYDLLLLALGVAGRPSTAAELARRLRAASFSGVSRPAGGSVMVAWKDPKRVD